MEDYTHDSLRHRWRDFRSVSLWCLVSAPFEISSVTRLRLFERDGHGQRVTRFERLDSVQLVLQTRGLWPKDVVANRRPGLQSDGSDNLSATLAAGRAFPAAVAELGRSGWQVMTRDIDQIIELLRREMPGVEITQLQVSHPGTDDDGLWFIKIPGREGEVQIESSSGTCPFIIQSDFGSERHDGRSVYEVVGIVMKLFGCIRA